MKRITKLSLSLGEAVFASLTLAAPVSAQTAAGGGSTPSAGSTTSALPEAGSVSVTMFLALAGVLLVVTGIMLSLRTARQKA